MLRLFSQGAFCHQKIKNQIANNPAYEQVELALLPVPLSLSHASCAGRCTQCPAAGAVVGTPPAPLTQ